MAPPVIRLHLGNKIGMTDDHMLGAMRSGEFGLLLGGDNTDHGSAECFAHWQRIIPTPPAAACTTIVSPAFTG